MKLLYSSLAFGALAAAIVAWRLAAAVGDPVGAGALLGSLSGLGLGAGAIVWQRRLLRTDPTKAMTVFVLVFLVKLVFVTGVALTLRFGAVAFADWTAFLVAFPIAVMWTTCTGWVGAFSPLRRNHSGAH